MALASDTQPTFFGANVMPLNQVDKTVLPPIDRSAVAIEDAADESVGMAPRFAIPRKVDVSSKHDGTWETLPNGLKLWRFRVVATGATSVNLGFTLFNLPNGASLWLYSADGKKQRGPFGTDYNRDYKQLWSPVILSDEVVIELTIPALAIPDLELELGQVGQGYRGFGTEVDKSGSCNMDVACLTAGDPWQDQSRSVAVISTGGSRFCSGSLINNTANDNKMYFITAHHCTITAANAATLVTYWNYQNSICRLPGSAASGAAGDGSLAQFNTGAVLRGDYVPSDFTLVEMSQAPNPAFNLYWEGWDHTPYTAGGGPGNGDFACMPGALCAGIHHPNTDEKRITFMTANTTTTSYNNAVIPGDGTHVHSFWDPNPIFPPSPATTIPPGVTEPGSSGSPLYNAQHRYIGQLHGGPSACGSTGANLSDYYGKFAISWEGGGTAATRVKDWLDPGNTGAMTLDGRNQCTAPAIPSGTTAVSNGANHVDVSWTTVPGATSYKVYRGNGVCPGTGWALIASNVVGTTYADTTVSGGITYSYSVSSYDSAQTCESSHTGCSSATATGVCTLSPTFTGATSAASSGTTQCGVDVNWTAGGATCGSTLKYNLYRSTTSGFTPGPSNLLASCQTGTTYHDSTVTSGPTNYYVVRAEDNTTNGTGVCNLGNEDSNVAQRAAGPGGPPAVSLSDDAETANSLWTFDGSGAGSVWATVTTVVHSPTHSWFSSDVPTVSDRRLALTNPIAISSGSTLDFWNRYNLEAGSTPFDGGVLEYSLDGTTWFDILAGNGGVIPANANRFVSGGYPTGTISSAYMSPISGRKAWSGDNAAFVHVVVNLNDFAGQSIRLRWRLVTDNSAVASGTAGWWVDDVQVSLATACSPTDLIFKNDFE